MKINEKNLCVFASTPPFDMEGYLNKRGEGNKAFQKRYFVLKGNLLFYFVRKGDKEPVGLIIVEGCTIELSAESTQYCFEIAFNGNRTYVLSADSQEYMELWMKALTCAGYEYKKLVLAELQRQLEEIEGSRTKILSEITLPPSVPKPPPRRVNPFNRPAPPPPPPNKPVQPVQNFGVISSSSANIIINGHLSALQRTNVPETDGALPVSAARKASPVQKQQQLPCLPPLQSSVLTITFLKTHAVDPNMNSFQQIHEAVRLKVMKDVVDYHLQQELKTKPLIQF